MKTVVALFERYEDAEAAIEELHRRGVDNKNIGVLAQERTVVNRLPADPIGVGMAEGAVGGAALGGLTGLLIGIGALTVPGVGPAFAAGTVAAAISATAAGAGMGAVGGGLLGALAGWGVPKHEAMVYAEGVKRGGILVVAHVPEPDAPEIARVFQTERAIDVDVLRKRLSSSGWSRYDEAAIPDENYPKLFSA